MKKQIPLSNLRINYMSAKSATKILSVKADFTVSRFCNSWFV